MAIRTILHLPDSRLRKKAQPVTNIDSEIQTLIDDMFETMYDAPGIGLAATQIGVNKQVLVMDLSADKSEAKAFINAEILEVGNATTDTQEGCLSVPGYYDSVTRPNHVKVRYINRDGDTVEEELTDLAAVCLQHEIDHLNGKLFIDYLSPLKRQRLQKKMLKQRRKAV